MSNLIQLASGNQRSQSFILHSRSTVESAQIRSLTLAATGGTAAGGSWSPENRHMLELQRGTTSGSEAKLTTQVGQAVYADTISLLHQLLQSNRPGSYNIWKPVFVLFSNVVMAVFELSTVTLNERRPHAGADLTQAQSLTLPISDGVFTSIIQSSDIHEVEYVCRSAKHASLIHGSVSAALCHPSSNSRSSTAIHF